MLADAGAVEGDWLVALEQTAGKGRQGRKWVSAKGNFYGTTLVGLRPGDPPPQTLSLAAGLALIEAIDGAATAQPLMLKWPNDLMLGGKKLGGILLERSGDRVAVGFGVNLAAAPRLPDREAADLGGDDHAAGLRALDRGQLRAAARAVAVEPKARRWSARGRSGRILPGTRLTVHVGKDETLSGRFAGLETDGALRLMLDDGTIEVDPGGRHIPG